MLTSGERSPNETGATLLEVLVALGISALVLTALGSGFFGMLRGNEVATDRLSRSAQTQRIGAAFTRDVQNVAPNGINAGTRCPDPSGVPSADEVDLVHFTRSASATPSGASITASWVAVGRGADLKLVRRECGAGATTEQVMARRIASGSQTGTDVVHGPDTANPTEFCPARAVGSTSVWDSCTIIVAGTLDYSLTVTRRVPDRDSSTINALPPQAPQNVTVSPRNGYLAVAWQVVVPPSGQPPVTSYEVFVYGAPAGAPIAVVTTDGQSTAADAVGLTNFTDYWVRVRAVNSAGLGEFSATIGPVQPKPTPPEAPLGVTAVPTGSDGTVNVHWELPANDGGSAVTGWTVIAEDTSTFQRTTFGVGASPSSPIAASVRDFVMSGLVNGRNYRIIVRAHNAVISADNPTGIGDESEPVDGIVPFGLPPAGTGVESQGAVAKAFVRWTPAPDGNGRPVVGYRVLTYRGSGATAPVDLVGLVKTTAQANCAATCLVEVPTSNDGQYYRYGVVTRTEAGPGDIREGAVSDLSTGTQINGDAQTAPKNPPYVRPSSAPAAPGTPTVTSNVTGTNAGTRKLTVQSVFGANGGEPIERARVQVRSRPTSGSTWTGWTSVDNTGADLASSTQTFVLDNLDRGRVFELRAVAANRADWSKSIDRWSDYSGVASLTLIGAPSQATSVNLVRPSGSFGKSLTLSWSAPADTGGESVSYSYSCSASGESTVSGSNATSPVALTNLRDGKTWTCAVTVANSAGGATPASSPAAIPFGECTVAATESLFVRQSDKEKNFKTEVVATRVEGSSNEIWGFLRFNLVAGCPQSGTNSRIPVGAYINDSQLNLYRKGSTDSDHVVATKTAYLSVFPETFDGKTMTASSITWSNTPSHGTVKGAQIATFNLFPPKDQWFQVGAATKTRELFINSNQSTYWWALLPERDGAQNNKAADFCATRGGSCAGKAPYLSVTFFSQGAV